MVSILLTVPFLTFAQTASETANSTAPCSVGSVQGVADDQKLGQLPRCVNQIYIWSLGVGALLALLMMIAGGYLYMTSSGNAEQSTKGVEYIWGAVIGMAILFTAYVFLRTINPELVELRISNSCLTNRDACQRTNNSPSNDQPRGGVRQ